MEQFFEVSALPGTKVTCVAEPEKHGVVTEILTKVVQRSSHLDHGSYVCLWEDGTFTKEMAHCLEKDGKKLLDLSRLKFEIPTYYENFELMDVRVKTDKTFDLLYFEKGAMTKGIIENLALFPPQLDKWVESDLMGAEVSSYSDGQFKVSSVQLASCSRDFRLVGFQGSQMASALQKDVQILSEGEKCLIPVIKDTESLEAWTAKDGGWVICHYHGNLEAKWHFDCKELSSFGE